MSETVAHNVETAFHGGAVPPAVRLPKLVQGFGYALARRQMVQWMAPRYGSVFTLTVPVFGDSVIVADPALAKQVLTTSTDVLVNIQPNLSRVLGSGSIFALDREEHRTRRKLLTPPFHGKSVKAYEKVFEEETLREAATWPEGREFSTLEPMMRITLNVILRTVFGAEDAELDELRRIVPPFATLGSRLMALPRPPVKLGRYSPWGRLAEYHRRFDQTVGVLIDKALADPKLDERTDVLAMMLRSRYDDGTAMSRRELTDELLTLVAAGHETTGSTLAWAFERLCRHPDILSKLAAEAQTDDNQLRQATILEVQRVRTVIDFAGRHVATPDFQLGEWHVPQGYSIIVSILLLHADPVAFPDPERFDPYRFVGQRPPTFSWLAFGGGARRCIGATFANTEMDIVLRTVLRHFTIEPSTKPDEKIHARGIAYTPKQGGRIVLHRH